jgi:hypothetical protein
MSQQLQCIAEDPASELLQEFGELPLLELTNKNRPPDRLILFLNPTTTSWTLVVRPRHSELFCALDSGFKSSPQKVKT